jgi:hypothetical protein
MPEVTVAVAVARDGRIVIRSVLEGIGHVETNATAFSVPRGTAAAGGGGDEVVAVDAPPGVAGRGCRASAGVCVRVRVFAKPPVPASVTAERR